MRSAKYCSLDEENLRKRAQYLAMQQVKSHFQYEQQRRDMSTDYKMETKMINGQ